MSPRYFAGLINSFLPEPHASLLNGILLGIPLEADREFYRQLQQVGLLHLVVLSGSNIAIVGSAAAVLLGRLPKRVSLLGTIACIIAFTLFVGPEPPIVRAAIMGCLALIAILFGKKNTALLSLLTATVFIAVFRPDWIRGISFQLSFGATLGIILFGSARMPAPRSRWESLRQALAREMRISLSASVFTVPIIFLKFHQVSLISPLANLAVSWTIAPLMAFGAAACLLGSVTPFLGSVTSYICYGLLQYMVLVIRLLARVPGGYFSF